MNTSYRFTGFMQAGVVNKPNFYRIEGSTNVPLKSAPEGKTAVEQWSNMQLKLTSMGYVVEQTKAYNGLTTANGRFFERVIVAKKIVCEALPAIEWTNVQPDQDQIDVTAKEAEQAIQNDLDAAHEARLAKRRAQYAAKHN